MSNFRMAVVVRVLICCVASLLAVFYVGKIPVQAAENEKTIWELENSYWQFVQANDLVAYRALWHKGFLGWPSVSAMPVNKEHITDWITSQMSQGLTFKFGELKPAGIEITGDIAVVYYCVRYKWVDKEGAGPERNMRVTHTWVKNGEKWVILGGMSMAKPDGE